MALEFLNEYEQLHKKPRERRPVYIPEGDCLVFYADDRLCHADRKNSIVTVYVADEDKSLAGCEIKGISRILRQYGSFGVTLIGGRLRIGFLFMMAGLAPDSEIFSDPLANQEIDLPDLQLA